VQSVKQPAEELDRISLLLESELARTGAIDLLQKLVRADLALKQPRIPYFLSKGGESLNKFGFLAAKGRQEEVVT